MATSRYRNLNTIGNRYETFEFPDIDLDNIQTFAVRIFHSDRLDALAFKHLGSGEYWWVLAWLNDISWGFDFEDGQIIKIPINIDDVLDLF